MYMYCVGREKQNFDGRITQMPTSCNLLHNLQILSHSESRVRLLLHILNLQPRRHLCQCQGALLAVDFKYGLNDISERLESLSSPGYKLTMSVIIVLTTLAPVTGKLQLWTILDVPSLATCSVATTIFVLSGFDTKSIAPPIPLNTFPGIM